MSRPATHIIAKQSFRFRFGAAVDATDVQAGIARLCNEELPARLNELFDNFAGPDTVVRIPRLEVRLKLDALQPVPAELGKRLSEEIGVALRAALQEGAPQKSPQPMTRLSALLFYLEHGYAAWWAASVTGDALSTLRELQQEALQELGRATAGRFRDHSGFRTRLKQLVNAAESPAVLLQAWAELPLALAQQLLLLFESARGEMQPKTGTLSFEQRVVELLLSLVSDEMTSVQKSTRLIETAFRLELIPEAANLNSQFQDQLTQIRNESAAGQQVVKAILLLLNEGLADKKESAQTRKLPSGNSTEIGNNSTSAEPPEPASGNTTDQRIRIGNAGLVLIAPYLGPFFTGRGLVADNKITDPGRAIALLRQCAFANTDCFEDALVLEKILCGMELTSSPGLLPPLSKEDIAECESLLSAIIGNWSVLKQTSADGLRQAFIQREGLLQSAGSGWQLKVQRQTHDILLDFLPWTYSMIRLPWMRGLIFVDWTK